MSRRMADLKGKRFGRLLVVEPTEKRISEGVVWRCICDCGREKLVLMNNLINGHTLSCGCFQNEVRNQIDKESGLNHVYNYYRRNAVNRNLVWELTKDDVKEITQKICFYCGKPPEKLSKSGCINKEGDYVYNGIDRVNNLDGYTLNNCVPCCYKCNIIKKDFSTENMIKSLEFLGYKIERI